MNKLYIDGENFLFKVAEILKKYDLIKDKSEITKVKISHLVSIIENLYKVDKVVFYTARLHKYTESKSLAKKSEQLIETRRRLKRYLTNDGVEFITSGNVRLQEYIPAKTGRRERALFKEKGVDVQLAIDIITDVCDRSVKTVLLGSSDSDMVPVVRKAQERGAKVVYVGFEYQPNRGLVATCDRPSMLRDNEIIEAYKQANEQ